MDIVVASSFLAIFKPEGKKHADIPYWPTKQACQEWPAPRQQVFLKWGIKEWCEDIVNIQCSFSLEKTKEHMTQSKALNKLYGFTLVGARESAELKINK